MPSRIRPPKLYLRDRPGRSAQWVILDRGREIGTGAGKADLRAAEKALADQIALKVLIANALSEYAEHQARKARRPISSAARWAS